MSGPEQLVYANIDLCGGVIRLVSSNGSSLLRIHEVSISLHLIVE